MAGELVRTRRGWITKPPTHCPNGHALGPGQVLVGHMPCGNGRGGHTTWTCRTCEVTVYGPPLGDGCEVLHGPAAVRLSNRSSSS